MPGGEADVINATQHAGVRWRDMVHIVHSTGACATRFDIGAFKSVTLTPDRVLLRMPCDVTDGNVRLYLYLHLHLLRVRVSPSFVRQRSLHTSGQK